MRWIYLFIGMVTLVRVVLHFYMLPTFLDGQQASLTGLRIASDVALSNGTISFTADNMRIYGRPNTEIRNEDIVNIRGQVECSNDSRSCFYPTIVKTQVELVSRLEGYSMSLQFKLIRDKLSQVYIDGLGRERGELVSGILLGGRGLGPAFKAKLTDTGLSHVVSASGMNVTLVAGGALWLLGRVKLRKTLMTIGIIFVIWLYGALTGFDSPIVRAVIMATFVLIGNRLGRKSGSWLTLGLAGCLMLWVDPSLLADYGFLLSFTSMIGQIELSSIKLRLPFVFEIIVQSFLQSAAAIIATLPIVLILFHKFSLVAIFTNVLVLWTIEPIMILGGIAGFVGILSQVAANYVLLPLSLLSGYFINVVNLFGDRPGLSLDVQGNWLVLVGYYILMATLIYIRNQQRNKANVRNILLR